MVSKIARYLLTHLQSYKLQHFVKTTAEKNSAKKLNDPYDSDEERRKEEEKARKRQVHAKVSSYWSLQWPWVSKKRVIYRESNCFMVPSKYEGKHRDKFPEQPSLRVVDSVKFDTTTSLKDRKRVDVTKTTETIEEDGVEVMKSDPVETKTELFYDDVDKNNNHMVNGDSVKQNGINGHEYGLDEQEKSIEEVSSQEDSIMENGVGAEENGAKDDDILDEVLNGSKVDENDDSVLDSILSDSENPENNKSIER